MAHSKCSFVYKIMLKIKTSHLLGVTSLSGVWYIQSLSSEAGIHAGWDASPSQGTMYTLI